MQKPYATSRRSLLLVVFVALAAWSIARATSLGVSGVPPTPTPPLAATQSTATAVQTARVVASYGTLPLHFEPNQGQGDAPVRFLARGPGYMLFLAPTEAILRLGPSTAPAPATTEAQSAGSGTELRMQLARANSQPQVSGGDPLPSQSHYFLGHNPAQHHTHVPHYTRVTYAAIYPGIDLVFYGNQRQLEYDFVVAPGADPQAILLRFEGADHLTVEAQGDLLLHLPGGALRLHTPLVYQEVDGVRQEIPGSYQLTAVQEVSFRVGPYDATRPLVIDPVLSYSTYLGGSGQDSGLAIAVDADGSAYIAGKTTSNFRTHNPLQPSPGGSFDAFVAKLNATGSALVYSTYLGGSGSDEARAIAVDSEGNAYVTGVTASANFPRVNPFQTSLSGSSDAFVAKLNATGSALVYSTYLGGSGNVDEGRGIAVDTTGHAYITGQTTSASFPPVTPLRLGIIGVSDAFVAKLQPTGSALSYLTYLGGGSADIGHDIAVNAAGHAYVTGSTGGISFPLANAYQTIYGGGGSDAFVAKLNATGSGLMYSTYFGGSTADVGYGIAVDAAAGDTYVTGRTDSTNFPRLNAYQSTRGGGLDAFVARLDTSQGGTASLVYSTYLGGSNQDIGFDIAVNVTGHAYVTGQTNSANFDRLNAHQSTLGGGLDAFVTILTPTGSALVYSTYLGGSAAENDSPGFNVRTAGIAIDTVGNAYVTGQTGSATFPILSPFQSTFGGVTDAFVVKLANNPPVAHAGPDQVVTAAVLVTLDGSGSTDLNGDPLTYTWTKTAGPAVTLDLSNPVRPTFTAPSGGTLTFHLTVSDGLLSSAPDAVTVRINHPPAADAGPDQGVSEGALVTLDGSGSSDPDDDTLTHQWTQTDGPSVTLDLSDPVHPTFVAPNTPPAGATLTFQLNVTDETLASIDVVNITVNNVDAPPVADAGPDQSVNEGVRVTLDGSGSSDPDGDALSYSWSQLGGPPVVLQLTDPVRPTFTAPLVSMDGATLTFQLTVDDGFVTNADVVHITVNNVNTPPVANAGTDQSVPEETRVTLNGAGSSDPDGDALSYDWEQVAGPTVSLVHTNAAQPTFTAPTVPMGGATLTFQLVVRDGVLFSDPDTVDVVVTNANHTPVADAGVNQRVSEASLVLLDGSGSFDPDGDGLLFTWRQTAGDPVTLSDPMAAQPTFIAPSIGASGMTLTFELTVSDGLDSAVDTVTVQIDNFNHPPTADAGPEQTRNEGSVVTLDGSGSSDPDGDELSYAWSQLSGPPVVLSDSAGPMPAFTAPPVGPGGAVLVFELRVDDGLGGSATDEVTVTVLDINDPPVCEQASASPDRLWPPNHKLVPVTVVGVADPNNNRVIITVTQVRQDEPVNGLGDGDTSPDAVIQPGQVLLRAERAGNGNGRVYCVTFTADNSLGGRCTGTVTVCVPHNRHDACVQGSQVYDSTQP